MSASKIKSNQNIGFFAGPVIAVADVDAMKITEANALLNISEATKWDSFDVGVQASKQDEDRALTDAVGASTRGYENFGGNAAFFTPTPADTSSRERQTKNLVGKMHTELVLAVRPGMPAGSAWAAGQIYDAMQVITDAVKGERGDKNRFYSINFRPKGKVRVNGIVPSAVPTAVATTPATLTVDAGETLQMRSTYEGHDITVGATYTVADMDVAEVTRHGIIIGKTAGTTTVTVTYPGSAAGTAKTITVE